MGNVILSRFPLTELYYYTFSKLARGVIVAVFNNMSNKQRTAVCSAHLTAFAENDSVREIELKEFTDALINNTFFAVDDYLVVGDLNFHKLSENLLPEKLGYLDLWNETRFGNEYGCTFDAERNSLIKVVYFGMEHRRMRLDRILASKNCKWFAKTPMTIFGDKKIKNWDYLFISDHFGLSIDLTADEQQQYDKLHAPHETYPLFKWNPNGHSLNILPRLLKFLFLVFSLIFVVRYLTHKDE